MKNLILVLLLALTVSACKKKEKEMTYEQLVELTTGKSKLDHKVYVVDGQVKIYSIYQVMKSGPYGRYQTQEINNKVIQVAKNKELYVYDIGIVGDLIVACNTKSPCKFFFNGKEFRKTAATWGIGISGSYDPVEYLGEIKEELEDF